MEQKKIIFLKLCKEVDFTDSDNLNLALLALSHRVRLSFRLFKVPVLHVQKYNLSSSVFLSSTPYAGGLSGARRGLMPTS